MFKLTTLAAAIAFAFSCNVNAEEKTAAQNQATTTIPQGEAESVITLKATVDKSDLANRLVTLKDMEGNVRTVKVGPEVKNLAQVKVGDVVTIRYIQAVAVDLKKG